MHLSTLSLVHLSTLSLVRLSTPVIALVFVMSLRRVILLRPLRPPTRSIADGGASRARRTFTIRAGTQTWRVPHWHAAVVVGAALITPLFGLAAAVLVVAGAVAGPGKHARRLQREWGANVPDLVELVRLALGSGCTTHLSLLLIAEHAGGPISAMLERTALALGEGATTADALAELQERVGAPIRPLCSALLGSERYGLPLSATLEALAVEARLARRRDAELRSRRLPVLLIFPLVVCILPAFALLTVVPLLGGGLSSLSW